MLLTITTTHRPATDLGFLLHKNPARLQTFRLSFGRAHVFYPTAHAGLCTAALLVEVDPVQLARGRSDARAHHTQGIPGLQPYVNDRPYVASSFLSVAIAEVLGSALAGRSKERSALTGRPLPFRARVSVLPAHCGEALMRRLFEPLGYQVSVDRIQLDESFPAWEESPCAVAEIAGTVRLQDLLSHLYVLIPVLDAEKHYWVGADEIDKLLRHGREWLSAHPDRQLIVDRYLARQRPLIRAALARLLEEEGASTEEGMGSGIREEDGSEALRLHELRHTTVLRALHGSGARSVVDLGCGEGRLLRMLVEHGGFDRLTGMDVSPRSLEHAAKRLGGNPLLAEPQSRVELIQGSLTYRDRRLEGYDAAVAVEVIEHLDPSRLGAFERVVFEYARPGTVILTTPNAEYNAVWETLPAGNRRHRDHRFEWTRADLASWSMNVAARHGYRVCFQGVGAEHPQLGPPTQMAIFGRA